MRTAQASASREDFQYHFGAFLALIGGLRQFITVKPHTAWVYAQDEQDLNYCACIDLRNVDVHVDNAVGTPRSEYAMSLHTTLNPVSDFAAVKVRKVGEHEWTDRTGPPPPPPAPMTHDQTTSSATARFFVNPDLLPPDFAVLFNTHAARGTKAAEEALLRTTPAVEVAEKALDFYEHTVLPGARAQGIPIR
jgi:hypothetical protein